MERSRRSVLLSVPPLWLIGVCLFLPTVRACERMESPATLIKGGTLLFGAMLLPYVVAELLAILTIVALARNRLTPLMTRVTAALVVVSSASAIFLTVTGVIEAHRAVEQAWGMFAGACLAAAAATAWRARRADPWTRHARLLAAYALFTLPLATLLARIGVEDGVHKLGVGAWLFFVAVAALLAIHARPAVPSLRREEHLR